jgi:hypothetical protein
MRLYLLVLLSALLMACGGIYLQPSCWRVQAG